MAWKTIIDKLDKNNEPKNTVVNIPGEHSAMYYIDQTGAPDKKIYGQNDVSDYGGQITLPRLAMNYYLLFMIAIFLVFLILWIKYKDHFIKV